MECIECGNDVVRVKKTKVYYGGIHVDNVYLRNCEVEVCSHCRCESPVVRNIKKVHQAIAIAIALQPARLTGEEVRFLRRSLRFTVGEWAERIGIAPETFSRWENGRSPAQQVEKLARIDFLVRSSDAGELGFDLSDVVTETLTSQLAEKRDFAILVDMDDLGARPRYESLDTLELTVPSFVSVTASAPEFTWFAEVIVTGAGEAKIPASFKSRDIGETCDASNPFALAA